jgi:hypothetical protein
MEGLFSLDFMVGWVFNAQVGLAFGRAEDFDSMLHMQGSCPKE